MGEIFNRLEPPQATLKPTTTILVDNSGLHDLALPGTRAMLKDTAEAKLDQSAPSPDHDSGKSLTGPQAKIRYGYGSVVTGHNTGGTYHVTEDTAFGPSH